MTEPAAVRRIKEAFARSPAAGGALDAIARGEELYLSGLWGASQSLALACAAQRLPGVMLVVTAGWESAQDVHADLAVFSQGAVELLPQIEVLPGEEGAIADDLARERLIVEEALAAGRLASGDVVVAPVQALMQGAEDPAALAQRRMILKRGTRTSMEDTVRWLSQTGFEREDLTEGPGCFAVRGGILDVFPPNARVPYRLEFFGDEVDSVRLFDPETQESLEPADACVLVGMGGVGSDASARVPVQSLLPNGSAVALVEPLLIQEQGRRYVETTAGAGVFSVADVLAARPEGAGPRIHLSTFRERFEEGRSLDFGLGAVEEFPREAADAVKELVALTRTLREVVVFASNQAEESRLAALLAEAGTPNVAGLVQVVGRVSRGFVSREDGYAAVCHHEIFHRSTRRYEPRKPVDARPIDSFLDLSPGDMVVHATKGIAVYEGLKLMEKRGGREEFLSLRFAQKARLYVPAARIDAVHKYVGAMQRKPQLSKLAGRSWERRKAQALEATQQLALELLEMQAAREVLGGVVHPPDGEWQRLFEAEFAYEETHDQLEALDAIKRDMESSRAMDRLMCGDVGYGKTEIAVRAAFKTAAGGKQVAVLAPTTLLVEQHYRTFRDRLADYPVVVRALDRFRTGKEERDILAGLAGGGIDVVVGTHRLLQKDISFRSLGLLVVDEEQRFGVRHKEMLKRFEVSVDCLALSATPIPRTLHLALVGLKDISTLQTPPQDRLAIETIVCRFDERRVRLAILRELARNGQVFFVHNRVRTIRAVAERLENLVPEARFVVAHGQMPERELERHMRRFLSREADVLVATTIIENGLDIPTANTIFIDRSDRFGLAELHQLRGRVGRYKHRAYAYMLLPEKRPVTPVAARRLRAIADHSELGSGFKIAMRDLEIRGAGNILGAEQSGHIAAVGYEMYCRLLAQSVSRIKNESVPQRVDVAVELGADVYIPATYIPSDRVRMEMYRKLAEAVASEELDALTASLRDRFGEMPMEVERLAMIQRLRVRAGRWGVRTCQKANDMLQFTVQNARPLADVINAAGVVARVVDPETVVCPLDARAKADPNALLEFALTALADA